MATEHLSRKELFREISETLGIVPKWLEEMPEIALHGFWDLAVSFWLARTAIPNRYKELMGVALAGATRCRYCALFHTEAARLFGASDDEIAEASMMGAVSMCSSTFINAQQTDYQRFKEETLQIIEHLKNSM